MLFALAIKAKLFRDKIEMLLSRCEHDARYSIEIKQKRITDRPYLTIKDDGKPVTIAPVKTVSKVNGRPIV